VKYFFQREGAKAQKAQRIKGNGSGNFPISVDLSNVQCLDFIFQDFSLRPLQLCAFALDFAPSEVATKQEVCI